MIKDFLATVGAGTIGVCALLAGLAAVLPGTEPPNATPIGGAVAGTITETADPSGASAAVGPTRGFEPPAVVRTIPRPPSTAVLVDAATVRDDRDGAWPEGPAPGSGIADPELARLDALVEETGSVDVEPAADLSAETIERVALSDSPQQSAPGKRGCRGYRTYNPETGTYRGYDGKIHACP